MNRLVGKAHAPVTASVQPLVEQGVLRRLAVRRARLHPGVPQAKRDIIAHHLPGRSSCEARLTIREEMHSPSF